MTILLNNSILKFILLDNIQNLYKNYKKTLSISKTLNRYYSIY